MPGVLNAIENTFNTKFEEGGEYYEYYKEGGQYYTDYSNATNAPVDLFMIQRDIKAACSFFTEEYIWAQVQGGTSSEDSNMQLRYKFLLQ